MWRLVFALAVGWTILILLFWLFAVCLVVFIYSNVNDSSVYLKKRRKKREINHFHNAENASI